MMNLNELLLSLNKSLELLRTNGKIIIVSFQSLEDRIVKDFLNHNSGKKMAFLPPLSGAS